MVLKFQQTETSYTPEKSDDKFVGRKEGKNDNGRLDESGKIHFSHKRSLLCMLFRRSLKMQIGKCLPFSSFHFYYYHVLLLLSHYKVYNDPDLFANITFGFYNVCTVS